MTTTGLAASAQPIPNRPTTDANTADNRMAVSLKTGSKFQDPRNWVLEPESASRIKYPRSVRHATPAAKVAFRSAKGRSLADRKITLLAAKVAFRSAKGRSFGG